MATDYSQLVNKNNTIYNTSTGKGYATPDELGADLGVNSQQIQWGSIKADPNWSYSAPSVGVQAKSPTSNITPPANTIPQNQQYTPPDQGTKGVSQGGIIGNLINQSQTQNPNYTSALKDLDTAKQKKEDLATDYANKNADISSRPEGLTQQTGQQGILANLFAQKQAAIAPEYDAAVAKLGAANTQQGLQQSANQAAGGLNAPQFVTPGQVQVNPSQPGPGSTASGVNLSSLIGQRPSPSNPNITEYYNTQTKQGFATPQALTDFVNSQMPGANVNAQNVFDQLSSLTSGSGMVGISPQMIDFYAQQLASGQPVPGSVSGNLALYQQVYQRAQQLSGGSFNANQAAGLGAGQQAVTSQQTQQLAQFTQASQIASATGAQLSDLINTYKLNPSNLTVSNGLVQGLGEYTSNAQYKAMSNLINEITATYAGILGTGGDATNFKTEIGQSFINGLASGQSIQNVLASIDAQVKAKIGATPTQLPTVSGGNLGIGGNSGGSGSGDWQQYFH